MTAEKTVAEIQANENAFATFMAQMFLKYGPTVLEKIEKEAEMQKKSA